MAVAAVVSVVFAAGAVQSASAADPCMPAPKLIKGKVVLNTSLGTGVYARAYTYPAGVTNPTNIPTKISYVTASLATTDVVPAFAKIGAVANQLDLANQSGAIGYMNDDYFYGGTNTPWGALVSNSTVEYAPPRQTTVFSIAKKSTPDSVGYTGLGLGGSITIGANPAITVSAVNLGSYKPNTAVLFNAAYSHNAIPRGKASIAVNAAGKIVGVAKTGSTTKPKSGYVISAVGTAAIALQKALVGQKVKLVKPEAPFVREPKADTLQMTGKLFWGNSSSIPIIQTNTTEQPADPNVQGASLFDSYWNSSVPSAPFMIVIDTRTGLVVGKYSSSDGIAVQQGQVVVTFSGAFNSIASTLRIGTAVTVDRSYTTTSGMPAQMAVGRGPVILENKKVVLTCNPTEEQIRPRSVIAWNTKGQIWFITSTSGINMIDNGFRVGGSTAHQLAEIAQQLGATDAVRVDGGGSTTMIIKLKNALQRLDLPAESWYRPIPVGIAIVPKSK
jgi:hypothetical protein